MQCVFPINRGSSKAQEIRSLAVCCVENRDCPPLTMEAVDSGGEMELPQHTDKQQGW